MNNDVKTMTDGAAVVVGLGGFMGWLTPVVTLIGGVLTIVWLALRIYETETVQKLVHGKEDDNASNKS
jgi:Flp pilus assembly protein protease CpaA